MLGTTLGPYHLIEELGSGGMAAVYRAHQTTMGRDVAVKVIYQELADEMGREQFQREARLIARLEHPHILPVYDFDGQSNPPYIVMRYLAGGTLKEALHQHPPDDQAHWRQHIRWLAQVAEALDYAHRQGIIHRDLKPSNIILDTEKNAFLADFGIAALAGETPADTESSLTGTPFYCSPEQALGQTELGAPADLYALAVVAFEIFTHTLPFTADSFEELLEQHAHTPPPVSSQRNPTLPTAVDEIFTKALAKRPGDRPASAQALVAALTQALGLSAATPAAPTTELPPTEQNKTVTVLYADATEYANLVEDQTNAETARRALHLFWERATTVITAQTGHLASQADNHALALWGATTTHEDDAERALHTALALQTTLRELGGQYFTESEDEPLPLNLGIHTGLALIAPAAPSGTTGHPFAASGATLALAEKLAAQAEGQVLISHDTFREVQGVFDLEPANTLKVRGRKEALPTYRVMAVKARAFRVRATGLEGLDIPLCGREAELKQLQNAYLNALEERETQLVTLVGEAGVGKSRLLHSLGEWLELRPERMRWFQGRANAAMAQRPYALWREILSFRFQILADDPLPTVQAKLEQGVGDLLGDPAALPLATPLREMAHLMGYLAGFDLSASPHISGLLGDAVQLIARAQQLTQRFFSQLGARDPIVIILEDLQHADDASLTLFAELITAQPALPLLLIGLARPTLLERRPAWGQGPTQTRLPIPPLDKRASRELARELLQKIPEPPKELRDLLVERAEGNPLFMEELVKMLLDDRVILKEGDTWRVELSRLTNLRVPPSLVGVLQARLDTLLYPEKLTLQRAAVFGRIFPDHLLAALDAADMANTPASAPLPDLATRLRTLEHRGFIQRHEPASFAGSTDYAFTQALLRDLIYATLLERQLHTYHAACARWLAQTGRAEEYLPVIAEHFELARRPTQAAAYLELAGDKAMLVSSFAEARRFYTRALALIPTSPPEGVTTHFPTLKGGAKPHQTGGAGLQLKLAEVCYRLADFAAVRAALEPALAAPQPATRAVALAVLGEMTTQVQSDYAGANALLTEALPLARASEHPSVLARVLSALGDVHWRLGHLDTARAHHEESLALARELGDTTRVLFALNRLGVVHLQVDLATAERFFQETQTLAESVGNRERTMAAVNGLGQLNKTRGDWAAARAYHHQALTLAQELGARQSIALYLTNLAGDDIALRDFATARAELRAGLTLARELGAASWILVALYFYADLLAAEGQQARALALVGLCQRHPAFFSGHQKQVDDILRQWKLDPATIAAGLTEGAKLDFDTTVEDVARELGG